jgi:hypothetical protein
MYATAGALPCAVIGVTGANRYLFACRRRQLPKNVRTINAERSSMSTLTPIEGAWLEGSMR